MRSFFTIDNNKLFMIWQNYTVEDIAVLRSIIYNSTTNTWSNKSFWTAPNNNGEIDHYYSPASSTPHGVYSFYFEDIDRSWPWDVDNSIFVLCITHDNGKTWTYVNMPEMISYTNYENYDKIHRQTIRFAIDSDGIIYVNYSHFVMAGKDQTYYNTLLKYTGTFETIFEEESNVYPKSIQVVEQEESKILVMSNTAYVITLYDLIEEELYIDQLPINTNCSTPANIFWSSAANLWYMQGADDNTFEYEVWYSDGFLAWAQVTRDPTYAYTDYGAPDTIREFNLGQYGAYIYINQRYFIEGPLWTVANKIDVGDIDTYRVAQTPSFFLNLPEGPKIFNIKMGGK